MQFGLMSLNDHIEDPNTGEYELDQAGRHRSFVEQGVLAEEVGFDMVAVGEHHFCDYILSSPPVVLAAIAERTSTVRLATALTLAANLDPVRMAEDYATVDCLSGGRLEIALGRGALSLPYDVLGQDTGRSREIFSESVRILQRVWTDECASYEAEFRPSFKDIRVIPRPVQRPHPPMWIGAGSSEHSFDFAAELGLRLMIPTIFGPASNFMDNVKRYKDKFLAAGHDPANLKIATATHTFVTPDSQDAKKYWYPYYDAYLRWLEGLVAESTVALPLNFQAADLIDEPAMCGSPAQVIDMVGKVKEVADMDLHLAMFDLGGLPERDLKQSIELYGREVIPAFAS